MIFCGSDCSVCACVCARAHSSIMAECMRAAGGCLLACACMCARVGAVHLYACLCGGGGAVDAVHVSECQCTAGVAEVGVHVSVQCRGTVGAGCVHCRDCSGAHLSVHCQGLQRLMCMRLCVRALQGVAAWMWCAMRMPFVCAPCRVCRIFAYPASAGPQRNIGTLIDTASIDIKCLAWIRALYRL